jgi:SnoaL-like domain
MSDETEIARRMFADFNRGGFEAITWGIHPEVVCVPFEGWPGPSIYRGLQGWADLAAEWTENFDEYGFEVDRVIPIESGALVLVTQRGRIRGEEGWTTMPLAVIWSDFEDGRARSVRWFRSSEEAEKAAGLTE